MIEALHSFDQAFFLILNSWHWENLNRLMVFISGQVLWIPLIGGVLYLAWKRLTKKQFSVFVLFLFLTLIATDVTSSYVVKNMVQRLRPCRLDDLRNIIYQFGQKCGGRFGFVSSHAGNSLALISFSCFSLKLDLKRFWPLWVIPLLVGYSRIYLGVHYPGDILGGFFIGMIWSLIFSFFFQHNLYGANRTFSQP